MPHLVVSSWHRFYRELRHDDVLCNLRHTQENKKHGHASLFMIETRSSRAMKIIRFVNFLLKIRPHVAQVGCIFFNSFFFFTMMTLLLAQMYQHIGRSSSIFAYYYFSLFFRSPIVTERGAVVNNRKRWRNFSNRLDKLFFPFFLIKSPKLKRTQTALDIH